MRTLLTQTRRSMCDTPAVQELYLGGNKIGDVGVTALANASGSLAQLTVSSHPADPFQAHRALICAPS